MSVKFRSKEYLYSKEQDERYKDLYIKKLQMKIYKLELRLSRLDRKFRIQVRKNIGINEIIK